uniref:Uncharacterized protein n=1 Tax=Romanomermis culicivorax TaxID=13658 RepID=A0A915HTH9_ROMCU
MNQTENSSKIEHIDLDHKPILNLDKSYSVLAVDVPSGSIDNMAEDEKATSRGSIVSKIELLKRRIKKYDKYMDDLQTKINELGNMEIGCDNNAVNDDEIFEYLGRLEEKLLKLRKSRNNVIKLIDSLTSKKTTDTDLNAKPELYDRPIERLVRFSGSGYACIDKALTAFVNKWKKKSASNEHESLNFRRKFYQLPSYDDILKLIRKENSVHKLNLNTNDILALSQDVGGKLYNLLKKYTTAERKQALIDIIPKDIPRDDPAIGNPMLEDELVENEKIGSIESKKLAKDEVIDSETTKFVEWISSTGKTFMTLKKFLRRMDCSTTLLKMNIRKYIRIYLQCDEKLQHSATTRVTKIKPQMRYLDKKRSLVPFRQFSLIVANSTLNVYHVPYN